MKEETAREDTAKENTAREESAESFITAIRKETGKPRYTLYIDGRPAVSVHEDVLVKHRLAKGQAVDRRQLQALVREDEEHKAYLASLRRLGRRMHSEAELKTKLLEVGYSPESVQSAVERLKAQGYVDDAAFAAAWLEMRIRGQKKGRRQAAFELAQKGVDGRLIAAMLDGLDAAEEAANARSLAEKKWASLKGTPPAKRQKLAAFLLRRGYEPELVYRICRQVAEGSGDPADDDLPFE